MRHINLRRLPIAPRLRTPNLNKGSMPRRAPISPLPTILIPHRITRNRDLMTAIEIIQHQKPLQVPKPRLDIFKNPTFRIRTWHGTCILRNSGGRRRSNERPLVVHGMIALQILRRVLQLRVVHLGILPRCMIPLSTLATGLIITGEYTIGCLPSFGALIAGADPVTLELFAAAG
jgi:hypothetical protein